MGLSQNWAPAAHSVSCFRTSCSDRLKAWPETPGITTFLGGGLTIAGLTITALIQLDGILQFQMDCWHKTRSAPFFSPPKLTCRWMFIPLKSG